VTEHPSQQRQPYAAGPELPVHVVRAPSALTRWLAILLLLVAAALVWTVLRQRTLPYAPGPALEPRAITPRGDLAEDEKSTIELFRSVSPSVVHITSRETRPSRLSFNVLEIPQGTGSGFLWDERGHVVTNFHVMQHADHAEVTLSDNTVWRATIVGVEPDKDLAVLRIEAPADKLVPIPIGTSSNLLVGQKVFAIGNPFGLDQTLTTGVISGLGREIKAVTRRPIYDVIQTDAPINPGNSGGPLLDSAGRLIGVNTAIYSPSGTYAGIGFAVPVDTVNRIVPQLISAGRVVRPGLGIHIGTDQLAAQLNLEGVLIIDVPADSAAGSAGLHGTTAGQGGRWILGDVIVGIDGTRIRSSSDLFRVLDNHEVGDTVTLTVERGGQRREVRVTLQALP
jgi:S1-C subfamily serine protease